MLVKLFARCYTFIVLSLFRGHSLTVVNYMTKQHALLCGVGRADITPPVGTIMYGYAPPMIFRRTQMITGCSKISRSCGKNEFRNTKVKTGTVEPCLFLLYAFAMEQIRIDKGCKDHQKDHTHKDPEAPKKAGQHNDEATNRPDPACKTVGPVPVFFAV